MLRAFKQHIIRKQTELEGLWDFEPIDSTDELPDKYTYKLSVPGCWEMHPDFLTYRGMGSYRTFVTVNKKCNLKLDFKGVSHSGHVFFDGVPAGYHYNAYTPFYIVIQNVRPGKHELVVNVDNTFSDKSSLHKPNDYYTYGGITRTVSIEEIQDAFIERISFVPLLAGTNWHADVSVHIKNLSPEEKEFRLKAEVAGREIDFGIFQTKAGEKVHVNKQLCFDNIAPWSAEHPDLYTIEAQLSRHDNGEPFDDLIDRVGFRVIALKDRKLYINNSETKLRGFNRHEDHPHYGAAIPFSMMLRDLYILKDTGSNAVRTCHYPNDEIFLDLCDELGFYVWEENHARGLDLTEMESPYFSRQCRDCNREMVENHINHPSIVIWGILNECASSEQEGRKYYAEQLEQIRDMDKSRPLSYASNRPFTDICLDLADIVSFNLYYGWYDDLELRPQYDKFLAWADSAGAAGKPVIISEFGAAAIYGFREPTRVRWSEERQADILDEALELYIKRPEICGTFIWQFCDCRITEEGTFYLTRPRNKNNKGVLDEYRRPKLSYSVVQKHFRKD